MRHARHRHDRKESHLIAIHVAVAARGEAAVVAVVPAIGAFRGSRLGEQVVGALDLCAVPICAAARLHKAALGAVVLAGSALVALRLCGESWHS